MNTHAHEHIVNCPSPETLVSLLRNELEGDDKEPIAHHIQTCTTCQRSLHTFRETLTALTADTDRAVTDLTAHIMSNIPESTWRDNTTSVTMLNFFQNAPALRIAASIALVVGLGYLGLRAFKPNEHTSATEQNLARQQGEEWLVRTQDTSGKWKADRWGGRPEYTVALTGMGLLSLVRSQDTIEGRTDGMRRAVDYLLSQQTEDGRFGEDFDGTMYNHGIATVALLEAYLLKQNTRLETPIKNALAFIRRQQLPTGGWGYRNTPGETANSAVSSWPLQALLLSDRLGWEGNTPSLRKGLGWLVSIVDDHGQFGYAQLNKTPTGANALTAMGAYCVFKASNEGHRMDSTVVRQIKDAVLERGRTASAKDFYQTYFLVAALREMDDEQSAAPLGHLQQALTAQRTQSGETGGSWDPKDQWGSVGGRVYSTTLASLALASDG